MQELVSLAAEVGLDPESFRTSLEDRRWEAAELEAVRHAKQDLNVRMVPTVFLGEHRLEGGAQSVQELRDWLLAHVE